MGKRLILLGVALAGEAALLGLAQWQYVRMQEKDALAAAQEKRRPVLVQGEWKPERTVALDNQPAPDGSGRIGWRILTPMALEDSTILVDRGWVPLPRDRTAEPDFAAFTPTTNQVMGVTAPYPVRKGILGGPDTTTNPKVLAWLNPALAIDTPIGTDYVQAITQTAPGLMATPPEAPDGKQNGAYALQWLMMALAWAVCWVAVWFKTRT
jgi:cytochrome oxidase assembly protein ShyY1